MPQLPTPSQIAQLDQSLLLGLVLIQLLAQTQKNNQQIGITGLSDHFKKIFNMVGITKFAEIYDTHEKALEHMS